MSNVDALLEKIDKCPNIGGLFALEKGFNRVGLTIQQSSSGRVVVCKIEDNKPKCDEVFEDYIFLGRYNDDVILEGRILDCLVDFIKKAAGEPSEIKNVPRVWQDGVRFYGEAIAVMNEDANVAAQKYILG